MTSSSAFGSRFDLASVDGRNGFVIEGVNLGDRVGTSVSGIGDFNGDGFDDVIVGAPTADDSGQDAGASYIIFGSATGFNLSENTFSLANLDGTNGLTIRGTNAEDRLGSAVSGLGDINNDGLDDVIVGAPGVFSQFSGKGYVIFGTSADPSEIDLTSLDGSNGFAIEGTEESDLFGNLVSDAGDINGDGFDDIAIADADYSYIVFGKASGFENRFEVSDLDGANGFVAIGDPGFAYSFSTISSAGDVNNDGIDDLIIGNPRADSTLVLAGSREPFAPRLEIDITVDEDPLDVSFGSTSNSDSFGFAVSRAGDVNGDGFDDVIASSLSTNNGEGPGLVRVALANPNDDAPEENFNITNSSASNFGRSVSSAGDINGDGFDDVLIGAPGNEPFIGGLGALPKTFVVFGKPRGEVFGSISFDGTDGFIIEGFEYDRAGYSVSGAGDINGDGIDDVIIGAPNSQYDNSEVSKSYVIFGRPATPTESVPEVSNSLNPVSEGTIGNDGIIGTASADRIEGLAGNDVLNGGAGSDLLDGGDGNDTALYQFETASVSANLATGTATDGSGDTDTLVSIENVIGSDFDDTLAGDDNNNSLTGRKGNDRLEGGLGADTLSGGEGEDILIGGGGADSFLYLSAKEGGDEIADFESGTDKLLLIGAAFGGLPTGVVAAELFFTGASATSASQRLGYNADTGEVLFDIDGSGEASAQTLATLPDFSRLDVVVL